MRAWTLVVGVLLSIFILVGCESEATPFPVDIPPTDTPIPIPTDIPTIRYALASNTLNFVSDLDIIRNHAQVEQLEESINPDDLGVRYDIVVSYGELAGWTTTSQPINVSLVLSPDLPADVKEIIQQGINPQEVIASLGMPGAIANFSNPVDSNTLQMSLANSGRPDGFSVVLAYAYTSGIMTIANQLAEINITAQQVLLSNPDILTAFDNQEIPLALVTWLTPEDRQGWVERFGVTNVIDLYSLPVSYRAVPNLQISLSENGFPLPSW